jgi:hypothetical protein
MLIKGGGAGSISRRRSPLLRGSTAYARGAGFWVVGSRGREGGARSGYRQPPDGEPGCAPLGRQEVCVLMHLYAYIIWP